MSRRKAPPCGPPADDEQAKALKVMNYAGKLDLYGVVILSKGCPSCGGFHSFSLLSNLPGDKKQADYGENLADLLRHMAEEAATAPVTLFPKGDKETLQ